MTYKEAWDIVVGKDPFAYYFEEWLTAREKCARLIENADKYVWHDIRTNPNDLPTNCEDVLAIVDGNGWSAYIIASYSSDSLRWFTDNGCELGDGMKVLKWRELEPIEQYEEYL